jgi:hypothetical protein
VLLKEWEGERVVMGFTKSEERGKSEEEEEERERELKKGTSFVFIAQFPD